MVCNKGIAKKGKITALYLTIAPEKVIVQPASKRNDSAKQKQQMKNALAGTEGQLLPFMKTAAMHTNQMSTNSATDGI